MLVRCSASAYAPAAATITDFPRASCLLKGLNEGRRTLRTGRESMGVAEAVTSFSARVVFNIERMMNKVCSCVPAWVNCHGSDHKGK